MPASRRQRQKTYSQHPFEERMRAIELYQQGKNSKEIARLMGLDDSMVRAWVRKWKANGTEALRPYRRGNNIRPCLQRERRSENENQYKQAYRVFATSLEPVASIARRFRFDYHSFLYHVQRYHPELVELRESLRTEAI